MAFDNSTPRPDDAVGAAIMRVLEAEGMARDSIAQARAEAGEIAERARQAIRAIRLSTDRRLERVRATFEAWCTTEVAELEAQATELDAANDLSPAEVARVERAVGALARSLAENVP